MNKALLGGLLCVLFVAGLGRGAAADDSFVLRAKAVYPVTVDQPGPIENGMIIVRDGKIVAVGRDLEVPPDLPLIELRDGIVCPGFVDAGSSLAGRHAGPHSVGAGYRALDAFDPHGRYATTLSRGTTTVHLDPGGHRLVTGRGAVVKLAGPPVRRVLSGEADLTLSLGVFDPPAIVDIPFYASPDVAIEPARRQRPDSRLGQLLELEERIGGADEFLQRENRRRDGRYDLHGRAFVAAWRSETPLRVQVRRAADIEAALSLLERHGRDGYLVGMSEGDRLTAALSASGRPVVLRIESAYRSPDFNAGPNPETLVPQIESAGRLSALRIALTGREGDRQSDLRMIGALAVRGGMSREQALAAITRVPAEILGVSDRVGSLAPGLDADLLVLSAGPLDIGSHVLKTYVGGRVAFEAPASDALVVQAGTIWVGDGSIVYDGSLLIENGKIQAVGQRVPRPPFARLIDAGPDAFVAPGFIDAHGHLGLQRDRTAATPDLPIHEIVGVAGREFLRVAQAGITTVMLAAYNTAPAGSRVSAIKTYGRGRDELIARELAGVKFSMVGKDPLLQIESLRKTLTAGKKYEEKWKKYHVELEKWEKEQASGTTAKKKTDTVVQTELEKKVPDPITGVWEFTLSGGPMPEVSGTMTLKLTDSTVEGRVTAPGAGEEAPVSGTFDGRTLTLEVDTDTPVGRPKFTAELDRPDHLTGTVALGEMLMDLEATRTDKSDVEFKVTRRRARRKDGKPIAPKVDENLEPLRPLLAGTIPALVHARSAAEIYAALTLFVDDFKTRVVLLDADEAGDIRSALETRREHVGVVAPPNVLRTRQRVPYNQAADLRRGGIAVALQSNAEDGARNLPLMGLFAVQQGLGGDDALRAFTIDAARMYRIDDRVGSLEPNKDADLLIYSGHPFDADSRLERVIVGGREVRDGP